MELTDFAFGTATVGSRIRYGAFRSLADAAYRAGVRRFDTAPSYGRGLAQVFLQRWLDEDPTREIQVSTKVGRMPTADLKSMLLVLLQGEIGHALRLTQQPRHSSCAFDAPNIRRCLEFAGRSMGLDRVTDVFVHAAPTPVLPGIDWPAIRAMLPAGLAVGVAEPCVADLNWLLANDNGSTPLQVSVADLMRDSRIAKYKGTLWINGLIRHSRARGWSLQQLMDELRSLRSGNAVMVVGFNHVDLFDRFVALR